MTELLIRNVQIVDGTGAPAFDGDVQVSGDRITSIRRAEEGPAPISDSCTVINGNRRLLTPGFIDVHSHSDVNILANPNGESKLRQGITTEVVGNCGFSAFPYRGDILKEEEQVNRKVEVETDWFTAEQYFERLERSTPAFNIATFVGHGNVRGSVMGFADRAPTSDEMFEMKREVAEALDAGAIGLSTGLIYMPGIFANADEIIELQKVATDRGGLYASHVRGEGDTLLDAAAEFVAVINGAQSRGQFSHLKASGPRNWGKVQKVIDQIEALNARGADVRFDKYPYIASSTHLSSILPRWVQSGGRHEALPKLLDPKLKDQIIRESESINEGRDGWDSVLICEAGAAHLEKYQGNTVGQVGKELGMAGGEAFLHLLIESELTTSISNFTMSQEETDNAILHPLGMVCSDAACRAPYGILSQDSPHPRAYGTFGKFFRDYVKERPLLKLEEAVRKVTSYACDSFQLRNRGRIAAGCYADLLLIDWPRYTDRSEFARPHQYCEGIDAIIVNGVLTLQNGDHTGHRGGRPLRLGRLNAGSVE